MFVEVGLIQLITKKWMNSMIVIIKVGLITKKWMGCWKETLTDADNFVLDFGDSMDLSQKVCAFVCVCVCVCVCNMKVCL